jgi:pimeloyl-ACP methyl ester carboxylesterase
LTVLTYRPSCANPTVLLVLHGLNRNADAYRKHARSLGDRVCAILVVPTFDKERFPTWRYQRGGIVHQNRVQPAREWTGQSILDLIAWIRRQEGPTISYSMIGHSAGGQFLSRVAAFTPTDAKRIVVANPSTHVFASLQTKAPFGMGGVYPSGAAEAQLRRYLQTPVTIFLGKDDVDDENRNDSDAARDQGETRYERGLNAFRTAQKLAQSRGWAFNWRLVELSGVGHSARKMFSSPEAVEALSP